MRRGRKGQEEARETTPTGTNPVEGETLNQKSIKLLKSWVSFPSTLLLSFALCDGGRGRRERKKKGRVKKNDSSPDGSGSGRTAVGIRRPSSAALLLVKGRKVYSVGYQSEQRSR